MHPILIPFVLVAASFAPTIVSFRAPATTPLAAPIRAASETPAITLEPGSHDLRELVNTFAVAEDCNYLFHDSTFGNTSEGLAIRLQSKLEVRATELRATLERLLYSAGIVIVPLDAEQTLCEIISLQGARRGEYLTQARPMDADAVLAEPDRYDAVVTTFVVDGVSAQQVSAMLRPFFAQGIPGSTTLSAVNDTKLAIAGTRRNVAAVLRVLRDL